MLKILFIVVMLNFERIEAEKSRFQIAEQTQKVLEKEAQTKQKEATIRAQAESDVAVIQVSAIRPYQGVVFNQVPLFN